MKDLNGNVAKKHRNTKLIIIVACILAIVVGTTYAFLNPVTKKAWFWPFDTTAETVDDLQFDTTASAYLSMDYSKYDTYTQGYFDEKSVTATAKLTRGNYTSETVTKKYSGYIYISENQFEYVDEAYPEAIMTVTDPSGNAVTSIEGLTYKTINNGTSSISGFDITGVVGKLSFASEYEISVTGSEKDKSTTHNWIIKVLIPVYKNSLKIDQSKNEGKNLSVGIVMGQTNSSGNLVTNLGDTLIALNGGLEYINSKGQYKELYAPQSITALGDAEEKTISLSSGLNFSSSYFYDPKTKKVTLINAYGFPAAQLPAHKNMIVGKYITNPLSNDYVSANGDKNIEVNGLYYVISYDGKTLKYLSRSPSTKSSLDNITDQGMFAIPDTLGTSYFFRGVAENNYLTFAGLNWRVVRINGDGSIRLIYADKGSPSAYAKNAIYDYKSSLLYTSVNEFYTNKLANYDSYIADAPFYACSDLTNYKLGYFNDDIDDTCIFSVGSDDTNMQIEKKIGLLSYDEFIIAGNTNATSTLVKNYLYENYMYWGFPLKKTTDSTSSLQVANVSGMLMSEFNFGATNWYVRPVISLNSNVTITGTGTSEDPFIVQ